MKMLELYGIDGKLARYGPIDLSDMPPDELDREISDLFANLRLRLRASQDDCYCPDDCHCRCGAAGQADRGESPDDVDRVWGY